MSWHDARTSFLIAVILYGCATVYSIFLWRKGFRRHDHINYFLLLAGMVFHTRAMIQRGLSLDRCPVNNLYEAMAFVAWTIAAAYLVLGLLPRLRHFGSFVAPVIFAIGVFALMPALDVPYQDKPQFSNGLISLHAALALLSYGAFGLSAVAALMYLTVGARPQIPQTARAACPPPAHGSPGKNHQPSALGRLRPPHRRFGRHPPAPPTTPGSPPGGDPKVPWSALVWLLYLGLIVCTAGLPSPGAASPGAPSVFSLSCS